MRFNSTRYTLKLAGILLGLTCATTRAADFLENESLRVDFDATGIAGIVDKATGTTIPFDHDRFSAVVDDQTIDTDGVKLRPQAAAENTRVYAGAWGPLKIQTIYELRPGWRFVTKRLSIESDKATYRLHRLDILSAAIGDAFAPPHVMRFAAFLRPKTSDAPVASPTVGLFLTVQNPFPQWQFKPGHAGLGYVPEMDWASTEGVFESDRVCIGVTTLTGNPYRQPMVPEWKVTPAATKPTGAKDVPGKDNKAGPFLDVGEMTAMNDCVRAFLLQPREKSIRVQVGWCVNDYQIDVATPAGREEYKRVIERAAAMGCGYQLFSPANSAVSNLTDNTDAWAWENVLWFGLGQKIRKGEWDSQKDATPPSVSEMLDFAKSKNVKLLAYIYPSLPFMQDATWTAWIKDGKPGGYRGADSGIRSFQNWLIDRMVAFQKKTGAGGFSFDHWWIAYDDATSKYAQWYGCRRVLEELRKRLPDTVIDGRQQYQYFGPWTWLGGSYPHPTSTDEQPQSFRAFPDLHFDRVCADRQRFAAWWFRVETLCPTELMPGYITHQTPRNDAAGAMRREAFRTKDWDVLGWKYSLISSIATAPFNHVVNLIPARDLEEYNAFSKADQAWFRSWLDWTDQNIDVLRHVRPILNQPLLGRTDGTAAFKDDRGFIFLFNPNYKQAPAAFTLDASIGVTGDKPMRVRQLYPDTEKGKLLAGPHDGLWRRGDAVSIALPGVDALVLEVTPATADDAPLVLGATGQAALDAGALTLTGVQGEAGEKRAIRVALPAGAAVKTSTVNGVATAFTQEGSIVKTNVQFDGIALPRCPQIGDGNLSADGSYTTELTVPARVFKQLEARRAQWPVTYTADDLKATWLGADRLLLFVNIAEPDEKLPVTLRIDGTEVPLTKAYTAVYPNVPEHTFVGWYADVSKIEADQKHKITLALPPLKPGQFQGVFLDNVEAEYTEKVIQPTAQN